MATKKSKPKPTPAKDPLSMLKRGAIAIVILVALAIGLNILQQVLFAEETLRSMTPTPESFVQDNARFTVDLERMPSSRI